MLYVICYKKDITKFNSTTEEIGHGEIGSKKRETNWSLCIIFIAINICQSFYYCILALFQVEKISKFNKRNNKLFTVLLYCKKINKDTES